MTEEPTRFPPRPAPCCGHLIDAATDIKGNDVPEVGDFLVCINCGAILLFIDPTIGLMRIANTSDWKLLDPETQWLLNTARMCVQRRGRIDPMQ